MTFTIDGELYSLVPGRKLPGLPNQRIVRTKDLAHISLAFPESETAVLFDMRKGRGFRLHLDTGRVEELEKKLYYRLREQCGFPIRRKRKEVPV